MKIKALVFAAAILVAGVANAQESYVTNSFDSNLYVGLSAGANASFDGFYGFLKGGKLIKGGGISVELSAGKWLTPEFGFRLNLTGLNTECISGWHFGENPYYSASLAFLWDATNTFAGYDPQRVVSVVPYLSAGYYKSVGRGAGFGAGIMLPIALTEKWSIVPDVRFVGFSDAVLVGPSTGVCANVQVTVGAQYKFGKKTGFETAAAVTAPLVVAAAEAEAAKAEVEAAQEQAQVEIKDLSEDLAKLQKENEALRAELDGIASENAAIVKNLMSTPACVFFEIGQATLSVKELEHLDRTVKTMIAQGKNITFTVCGYSDKNTGSARRNNQLAKQRANYIVKLLTEKYGLSQDKFVVKHEGNTNIYTTIELNRAVLIQAAE